MSTTDNPQANPALSPSQPTLPETPERIVLPPPPQAPPPEAAPTPSPAKLEARLLSLDRILVVLLLALAFLLAFFPIRNSDFLQQLAVGRLLTQGEFRFGEDPFTWTSEPASWANAVTGQKIVWVNHSWLFGLGAYLLYLLEPAGHLLVVVKSLLLVGLAGVMLQLSRRVGQRLWIPVLCTTLAVVVLSPRLNLQPFLLSYFCLGLTLWLLERPRLLRETRAAAGTPAPTAGRDQRSWWLLPVLFALWVNLDSWFLLGPLVVGIYWLGEVLQQTVGPKRTGTDEAPAGSATTLGLVFAAGLAACLLNPNHIHAFTLPAQLGLSEAASILRNVGQFAPAFASPVVIGGTYFHPHIGLSVAGLSYFVLLLLGLVSLFLGTPHWGRRLLFAALAALSLWNASVIPFFAIVAGPTLALNLLDAHTARAANQLLGMRTTPAAPRWLVAGRFLSILALLLLLVASVPGWLQARPYNQRRVGWGLDPDPSLKAAAQTIAGWRKQHLLPPQDQAHWCNTNPDLAQALAWYCPGERMYIDQRINLFPKTTEEYIVLRRSLAKGSEEQVAQDVSSWRDIFRARSIRFLLFYDPDLQQPSASVLFRRFASPNEWALLYMDGRTAIFGWIDPENKETPNGNKDQAAPDPYKELRLNLDREAFGPQCQPAPAQRPARAPQQREWYTELWDSTPMRPLDANLEQMAWLHFISQRDVYQANNWLVWETPQVGRLRGAGLQSANPMLGGPAMAWQTALATHLAFHFTPRNWPRDNPAARNGNPTMNPLQGLARHLLLTHQFNSDQGPPGSLFLALRAARRALAANPDNAQVYMRLGLIYNDLSRSTREHAQLQTPSLLTLIRHAQTVAALNQAVKLDPDLEYAHSLLSGLYEEQGYYDLFIKHRREQVRCLRKNGGLAGETPDQAAARLAQLEQQLQLGETRLKEQDDKFEVQATNKSPLERAALALSQKGPKYWLDARQGQGRPERFGLAEKALQSLEQSQTEDLIVKTPNGNFALGGIAQVDLWFLQGQLDKVRDNLGPDSRTLLGYHPDMGYPAYDMYQVVLAAASGDYEAAEKACDDLLEAKVGSRLARDVSREVAMVLAQSLLRGTDPHNKIIEATVAAPQVVQHLLRETNRLKGNPRQLLNVLPTRPELENQMRQTAGNFLAGRAELLGLQGWISLEAGRLQQAREQFEEAESLVRNQYFGYTMQPLVRSGLKWLKENSGQ